MEKKTARGRDRGSASFGNNSVKPTFCQQPGMGNPSGPCFKEKSKNSSGSTEVNVLHNSHAQCL